MMNTRVSAARSHWSYVAWLIVMPCLIFCNEPLYPDSKASSLLKEPVESVIIITEDATPEALEKLQQQVTDPEKNRELIITGLEYDAQGKISHITVMLKTKGASGQTSYEPESIRTFVPIYFTFDSKGLSAGYFKVEHLDKLIARYDEIAIYTAGIKNSKFTLQSYYPTLQSLNASFNQERMDLLEKDGWQTETFGRSTFTPIDASKLEDIEKRIGRFGAPEVGYIVDGGEKQAAFPDIPLDQIREISLEDVTLLKYIPHTFQVASVSPKETRVHIRLK